MLMAQPLDCFRVMIVLTVPELICSNEVQVELERVVQLPLELQVIPAFLNWLAAVAWDTLLPLATAAGAVTLNAAMARATTVTAVRGFIRSPGWGGGPRTRGYGCLGRPSAGAGAAA